MLAREQAAAVPEPSADVFGNRLKEIRKRRGLSQVELARRLGLHQSLISQYECGYLRLHGRFHHTERFTIGLNDGSEREFHFPRIGNGYAHEAMEVGRCLREGLLESPEMPLAESVELMGVLDELRAQIGVRYSVD